jgi:hypothetical protein
MRIFFLNCFQISEDRDDDNDEHEAREGREDIADFATETPLFDKLGGRD